MATYWKQLQTIIDDLDTIKREFDKQLAECAERDIIEVHKSIVSDYYSEYTPNSYRRHSSGGLGDTIISHRAFRGAATVLVGAEGMGSHGRKKRPDITKENVFDLAWNQGIRGLPREGSVELSHDVRWLGNHFKAGEIWRNPFWSGSDDPYRNIFTTSYTGGSGRSTITGAPADVLDNYVSNWDKYDGKKHADEVANNIKTIL